MNNAAYSSLFLKIRAVALSSTAFTSFLWVILLCLDIFLQWDVSDRSARSLILVLLITNTITVIILFVLLLLSFRPWLDAARILFLLVAHIGTAAAFAYWNPQFKCHTQTPDQEGLCKLLNIYVLIASWIVPALLILYACGLTAMVYRRSRQNAGILSIPTTKPIDHEEAHIVQYPISPARQSTMLQSPWTLTFPPQASKPAERLSNLSSHTRHSGLPTRGPPSESNRSSTDATTAKRLSKRCPMMYY